MKHHGSKADFVKQRNEDLIRAYRHQLAKASLIYMPVIFELIANSPAQRFYVSEERAAIIISRMASGKPLQKMRDNKKEMFDEIYRRYLTLQTRHPQKSIFELATIIVNQPAPKFYLSPRTIGEYIYIVKNRNERRPYLHHPERE